MSSLSSLTPEEMEIVVSLPFKAGVFVSYSEDEDGESDDEKEMKALERAISAHSRHDGQASLTHEVAKEVLRRKADWDQWAENVFMIEDTCEKAGKILKQNVSEKDLKAYIAMVLEISGSVAQAYGEFGMEEAPKRGLMGMIQKITDGLSGNNLGNSGNTSAAEDDSISVIERALKKYV